MSKMLGMSIRERWAAREVLVTRWLKQTGDVFRWDERIAELRVDGATKTITFTRHDCDDSPRFVCFHYVNENHEVGPWGELLEHWESPDSARTKVPVPIGYERVRPAPVAYRRRQAYPAIFLSYRRDDAEAYAGRLHETLTGAFGSDAVFMDQFSIDPGEHFGFTIQQAMTHARVVLALIGPQWHTLTDDRGRPRFDNERDFVRRELTAALDRGTTVVPMLLPNADVSILSRVHWDGHNLGAFQALSVTARQWRVVTDDLIRILRPMLEAR